LHSITDELDLFKKKQMMRNKKEKGRATRKERIKGNAQKKGARNGQREEFEFVARELVIGPPTGPE
jgi:hypothetical protein